jgi:dihydropteroate synthase
VSCLIVGVLNCTPDSFSDGGKYASVAAAVAAGARMAEEGANWIDVGGESTRPGAAPVSEADEKARVLPVIEGLRGALPPSVRISIDTYKAGTARAAVAAGASVINDVSGGLLDPDIVGVSAETGAGIVLGHLRGAPATMMDEVAFRDVVDEVGAELAARLSVARRGGCYETWVDPGHRLRQAPRTQSGAAARVAGAARAPGRSGHGGRFAQGIHRSADGKPGGRTAVRNGGGADRRGDGWCRAVRVHDVAEMRDVVRVAEAMRT